jgi:four helix bundle protein
MSNDQKTKIYDLEERTAKFGEDIIEFCKKVPKNVITIPLISQLVRSGTSVGSNYCEADCAESRKDFEHKLGICKKESKESKHWLRMIAKAVSGLKSEAKRFWKEANELQLIFISIVKKSRAHKEEKLDIRN